eukprot:m.294895 g.294895  ORF g.294895 m.294895 type:complete len:100 (+) comp13077_c0_seq1:206-505(+)
MGWDQVYRRASDAIKNIRRNRYSDVDGDTISDSASLSSDLDTSSISSASETSFEGRGPEPASPATPTMTLRGLGRRPTPTLASLEHGLAFHRPSYGTMA